jgi:hypothetical protein
MAIELKPNIIGKSFVLPSKEKEEAEFIEIVDEYKV